MIIRARLIACIGIISIATTALGYSLLQSNMHATIAVSPEVAQSWIQKAHVDMVSALTQLVAYYRKNPEELVQKFLITAQEQGSLWRRSKECDTPTTIHSVSIDEGYTIDPDRAAQAERIVERVACVIGICLAKVELCFGEHPGDAAIVTTECGAENSVLAKAWRFVLCATRRITGDHITHEPTHLDLTLDLQSLEDEGLGGTVAHEFSHALLGHIWMENNIAQLLDVSSEELEKNPLYLAWSRAQEIEADVFGAIQGNELSSLIADYSRAAQKGDVGGESHPRITDRLALLRQISRECVV